MACAHLRQLFELCKVNLPHLAAPEVIHLVCDRCGEKEVCPSVLMAEYDQTTPAYKEQYRGGF